MATQIHVIYSSDIMGAGMIAGGKVDLLTICFLSLPSILKMFEDFFLHVR